MENKHKTYIMNDYKGPRPKLSDDFYVWYNYNWLNENKIPDDDVRYTHFIKTQMEINIKLKKILETNAYPLATILYNSFLNSKYRNLKCLNELKDLLKIVDNISSQDELIQMATRLLFINVSTLFSITIDANIFSSCNNIMYIGQPSLGLPNRAYYHDKKYKKIRQTYYDTICKMYTEIYPSYTIEKINELATLFIEMETKFSILFLGAADRRDSESIYHQVSLDSAIKSYPTLKIDMIIQILCLLSDDIIIEQNFRNIIMEHHKDQTKNYFKQLEKLLPSYSLKQWKEYFKYHIILSYVNLTSDKMRTIHFDMFKKTLRGQKVQKPLWRSALSLSCSMLNDPISRIFSHNNFNSDMEIYMNEMVKNIKKATKERIKKLEWMSDSTKKRALLKLHKMKLKLGYSKSQPRNYDHVILTDSLIKNTIILNRENTIQQLNKLNSNVDSDDWELPSYIVNAYFNPTRNEIIFPASILQSPFLDLTKSDIYNYGNIGSVIGHEIIHGFDDQGAIYDETGSINNWWSSEDKLKYDKKVSKIIEIYDAQGVNGKLTAGENIADFGSVVMPLYALKYKLNRSLNKTDIQDFYKAYAHHWQYLLRPESAEERRLTDPHAFADLRVNIPLMHQKLFQEVFEIKPGDKMYIKPEDMLIIW
jgi:putative endopeptidase